MSMTASDKKKVFGLPYNVGIGFLCVLGALVLYVFYSNVLAGPSGVSAPSADAGKSTASGAAESAAAIPMAGSGAEAPQRKPVSTQRRSAEEFNPPLRNKDKEKRIDPRTVDPSLRLDLLAKVQSVELTGGTRNLFQFGTAPKSPELLAGAEPVVKPPIGPRRPPDKVEPVAPPPVAMTPIQLKFYGFSTVRSSGKKTAYFMDTDDTILIAGEGEMLKRRYLVKRIMATSVLMEDTESKRTETVPLTPEAQS